MRRVAHFVARTRVLSKNKTGFIFCASARARHRYGRSIDHGLSMGRNKTAAPLSKREKKLKEEGKFQRQGAGGPNRGGGYMYWCQGEPQPKRRTVRDTRRPAKSNSSILHAILSCVLVVIVVSWALGY